MTPPEDWGSFLLVKFCAPRILGSITSRPGEVDRELRDDVFREKQDTTNAVPLIVDIWSVFLDYRYSSGCSIINVLVDGAEGKDYLKADPHGLVTGGDNGKSFICWDAPLLCIDLN